MKSLEVVLKVSSICNLNCRYCYIFNQGDSSYKHEPSIINIDTCKIILLKVSDFCKEHSINEVLFIFHGGEPLLAGINFFEHFLLTTNIILSQTIKVSFDIQTNGTLLTNQYVEFFKKNNISIGISLDGSKQATSDRIFRSNNTNAYESIVQGIKTMQNNKMEFGVLSVVTQKDSVEAQYSTYKNLGIKLFDLLLPEISYDERCNINDKLSAYLIEFFNMWYTDTDVNKPSIRLFNIIIGLLLGFECGNEVLGRGFNTTICIKTDGNIQPVDSIRAVSTGLQNIKYNIADCTLNDFFESEISKLYYSAHQNVVLCKKCKQCSLVNICGGGQLSHRYSKENGFDNPSAYCEVMTNLIQHINQTVMNDLKIG